MSLAAVPGMEQIGEAVVDEACDRPDRRQADEPRQPSVARRELPDRDRAIGADLQPPVGIDCMQATPHVFQSGALLAEGSGTKPYGHFDLMAWAAAGRDPWHKSWEALPSTYHSGGRISSERLIDPSVAFFNMSFVAFEAVEGTHIRQATITGRSPKKLHRPRTVMAARGFGRGSGIVHETISNVSPLCWTRTLRHVATGLIRGKTSAGVRINRGC